VDQSLFESKLDILAKDLTSKALSVNTFTTAQVFENAVRTGLAQLLPGSGINLDPPAQAFPDIEIPRTPFGVEVKFTTGDSWRSVANSVLETNRVSGVSVIYVMYGKMGGTPEVRWAKYEDCVMHVRTSHVPRFELEIGTNKSLFDQMGISYDNFCKLEMPEK